MTTADRLTADEIARRLQQASGDRTQAEELPGCSSGAACAAAVLVPIFRLGQDWHLLYIRRAERAQDLHSGQVAFPGGRSDPGDVDAVATALREAWEEIGLDPECVRVLGVLRPLATVTGYRVTPVVGQIPSLLPFAPDPAEVAEVFSLPLAWLCDPANREVRFWPSRDHPQGREVVFFDERDGQRLWGVSAQITVDFIGCLP